MGRKSVEVTGTASKEVHQALHGTYQKDPGRVRSMSVKLDATRYRKLSRARFEREMSAQDIFIEALDMWFQSNRITG